MAQSASEEHFGSDEIREMFCEHCDLEGKYAQAEGFCVTCEDYMCKVCVKYHCQYKSDHDILAKSEMPTDVCFEKCSNHTSKLIKFYCECCSSFACSDCKSVEVKSDQNEDHRWRHLPMLLMNMDNSNMHKEFEKNLSEVKQKLCIVHKNCDQRKVLNDQCYEMATMRLEQQMQNYSRSLANIERDFQDRLRREKTQNDENIQAITQESERFNTEISAIENNVKKMKKLGQKSKLFISEVQHQQKLIEINCKLAKVKGESEINTYRFEPKKCGLASEDIGAFSVESNKKHISIKTKIASRIDTGLKRLFLPGDVDGMCLVKGIFLVIVSYFCKTIKVFKVEKHKELFSYPQSEEPYALTKLSDDQIAVSLFNKKKGWIFIFSVSDDGNLSKMSEIYTDTECRGLAEYENALVAVYGKPINSVNIMLPTGKIIKTIKQSTDGNALFQNASYVALSLDKTIMYVSDFWKHTVIMLTMKGDYLKTYKDDELKNPRGLTLDDHGLIYVCGSKSNNIHVLTPDLQKVAVIKDIEAPHSVLYDSKEKHLYIGLGENSKIKLLQITKVS